MAKNRFVNASINRVMAEKRRAGVESSSSIGNQAILLCKLRKRNEKARSKMPMNQNKAVLERAKEMDYLQVDHLVVGCSCSFHDRFRHRRVWMHGFDEFVSCSFQFADRNDLGNHLGDIGSDKMSA